MAFTRGNEFGEHRGADERPAVVAVVAVDADEIDPLVDLPFRQFDRGVALLAGLGMELRRALVELDGEFHHLVAGQHPEGALAVEIVDHHAVAKALASQGEDVSVKVAA